MANKKWCALVAAVAMTSAVYAEEIRSGGEQQPTAPVQNPKAEENDSALSLDANVKYVTAYISRGYNYGDEGLILQPEATAAYDIAVNDDVTITPWLNLWANLRDEHYAGDWDHFDEIDVTPAVDISFDRVTLSLQYIYYHSPAQNWEDIHEVGAVVSYDDSEQLGLPVAINPYVGLYKEISDKGGSQGTYAEIGAKPEWTPSEDLPLTLTFPVAVGLGINEWYFDDNGDEELLGFVSAQVVGTYNITDNLYVNAGVKYIRMMADSTEWVNDDDENALVGSVGVGVSY